MNSRIEQLYKNNLKILHSVVGLKINSAIEEQYYFEGKLDTESRGVLKLELSNGDEYTFQCDVDAESLNIYKGEFTDKRKIEDGFKDGRYKWIPKEFISNEILNQLGKIVSTEIQISNWYETESQTGCRINFQNGDFLQIWTVESDNIFYGLNKEANYIKEVKEKVKMIRLTK